MKHIEGRCLRMSAVNLLKLVCVETYFTLDGQVC